MSAIEKAIKLREHVRNETPVNKTVIGHRNIRATPTNKHLSNALCTPGAPPGSPMAIDSPPATKVTPTFGKMSLSPAIQTPTRKLFSVFSADDKAREAIVKAKERKELKNQWEQMRCFCHTCKGGRFGGISCCGVSIFEFEQFKYWVVEEGPIQNCWCVVCRGGACVGDGCEDCEEEIYVQKIVTGGEPMEEDSIIMDGDAMELDS